MSRSARQNPVNRHQKIWRRSFITATAAVTLAVGGLVSETAATAATGTAARTAIAGSRPTWAVAHGSKAVPAIKTGSVDVRIYLAGRDEAGLTEYATEVSTPSDSLYRHYLTPAQLRARFGATASQIAAIES